jgi:poly-gamma-glutamate capsule biosynthesis protein CapA/YwtB (metallophosphatase superfamily)
MSGTVSIVLTGDSIITRRISRSRDEAVHRLVEHIRLADVAFTNLEVLTNDFRGYPAQESGGSHLAAHGWVLDELVGMGFDLFATAHNHALDYSIEGLVAAMEIMDAKGITYAGVGHNLGQARMPVYHDRDAGTVALISCASSFGKGQQAGEQRPDMQGRPGLNPIRFTTTYEITVGQMEALRQIANDLDVEQQRLDRIRLGFGFPPDDPDTFPFQDLNFRVGERPAVRTACNEKDLEAIAMWTREARLRADFVIVSLHAHEQGATKEDPAEFIPVFARRMIDAGADLVVGHGPHLLRGMEIYDGKPIFYSLGNFVGQNELVYRLPADSYERFRVDPSRTPGDVYLSRCLDGKGFPGDKRYWQSLAPRVEIENGALKGIDLVPVTLGHGEPMHQRGRPRLATGDEAADILTRFAALSEPFGTRVQIAGEQGRVVVG